MSLVVPEFLYHGSAYEFKRPEVAKGRGYKDFGKGFYLSVDRQQATGMMHKKYDEVFSRWMSGSSKGLKKTLYRIKLDATVLSEMKIKKFDSADEDWLDFILHCRQFDSAPHDYDVVIGPTADDDTRLLLKAYVDGTYGDPDEDDSKQVLLRLLKPERLGIQWFIRSQSVADRLIKTFESIPWEDRK